MLAFTGVNAKTGSQAVTTTATYVIIPLLDQRESNLVSMYCVPGLGQVLSKSTRGQVQVLEVVNSN